MRAPETREQQEDRLRQQADARVREQTGAFKRVFARSGAGTSSSSMLEAVLIFLAIAGSALAATTWDTIFGDDPASKVATERSEGTGSDSDSDASNQPTAPPQTEPDEITDGSASPYRLEFAEVPGLYRLVLRGVSGPCSADPEDNPPIDVQVTILETNTGPTASEDRGPRGLVQIEQRDVGTWEAAVTNTDVDLDANVLRFDDTSANAPDAVVREIVGAFVKERDDINMNFNFEALGCQFVYSGVKVAG